VTKSQNEGMSTTNCNVFVRGGQYKSLENNYYGVLTDIVELQYTGHPSKKVVLFQCDWFDPSSQGTRIDNYGNVEIKKSRRYNNYDPFILAQQAEQVYFTSFPEGKQGWLGVIKTKARNTIQSLVKKMYLKQLMYTRMMLNNKCLCLFQMMIFNNALLTLMV
jgi:hypothetical protein